MAAIRLVHWNENEGLERQLLLEAFGFEAAFDFGDGVFAMRQIRASHPDAVVIDLTRMPSHGREIAQGVRSAKATRHIPIAFVGGEPEKVARTLCNPISTEYRPNDRPCRRRGGFKVCSVDASWSGLAFKKRVGLNSPPGEEFNRPAIEFAAWRGIQSAG